MKKRLVSALALVLLVASASPAYSAPKSVVGGSCSKAGLLGTSNATKLICTKVGTKLVWKSQSSNSALPTPTSFENLYASRSGVPYAAWRKVSDSIKANTAKLGALDIHTGPNTTPIFDNVAATLGLVSRAFSSSTEAMKISIVRYQYKDLTWADSEVRKIISAEEYDQLNRNEGGRILSSNCETSNKNCMGSKQLTTDSGIVLLLLGVPNPMTANDARFSTGMLEAHEYFHSLQRIQMLGRPLGPNDWPRAWIREGSAEWVQNAVINNSNYDKYRAYIKADCSSSVGGFSESEIIDFLGAPNDASASKYDQWLNYCLGAYAVEILVAVKDQKSITDLYSQMATGVGFEGAFKNVYGTEWKVVLPVIAKTIYANIVGK